MICQTTDVPASYLHYLEDENSIDFDALAIAVMHLKISPGPDTNFYFFDKESFYLTELSNRIDELIAKNKPSFWSFSKTRLKREKLISSLQAINLHINLKYGLLRTLYPVV